MFKSLFAMTVATLTLSAQAHAALIPQEIRCTSDNGYDLVIKDTGMESPFEVPLLVTLELNGRAFSTDVLRVKENTDKGITLEGHADSGNILRVEVTYESKTASRHEAANDGKSPLPSALYKNCRITQR